MAAAFQNLVTFPATVDFVGPSYNEPQTQILGLFNKNKTHRISFKIQANCRRHVDVSQVFGFVEPRGNCAIILTCKAMDAVDLSTRRKKHLTIISCDAQAFTGVNSERFWREHATNPNSSRLQSTYVPVNFWKDGAAHQAAQKGPMSMCTTFMGGVNQDQRMMSLYRVAEPGARPEELLVTALPGAAIADQGQAVDEDSPPSGADHNQTAIDNLSQMKTFQQKAHGGSAADHEGASQQHTGHNGHTYSALSGVTAVSGRHVSTVTTAPKSGAQSAATAHPASTAQGSAMAIPKSPGASTSTHSSASGYSTSTRSTGSDYSTTSTTNGKDGLPRINISLKGWGAGWGWGGGNKTGAPTQAQAAKGANENAQNPVSVGAKTNPGNVTFTPSPTPSSGVTTSAHSSASGYSTSGTSAYSSSRSTGSGYTTTGTSQASKAGSVNVTVGGITPPPVAIPPVGHAPAPKSMQSGAQSPSRGAGPFSRNAGVTAPSSSSRPPVVSQVMGGDNCGGAGPRSTFVGAQAGATGGVNAQNQTRPAAPKTAGAAGKAPKSDKPIFSQMMGVDKDVEQNRPPPRSMFVQVKGGGGANDGFKSEHYLDRKL